MATWKLANRKKPAGTLHKTKFVPDTKSELRAVIVDIPTEIDIRKAFENAGGLAPAYTRSLELWWDSPRQKLDVILTTIDSDIDKYKQDFRVMYPNASFSDAATLTPEWYDANKHYHMFDAGYRHGHIQTVWDTLATYDIITMLASAIQSVPHAWVQIVFRSNNFVVHLQDLLSRIRCHRHTVTATNHFTASDMLFSSRTEGRDHPEKGKDFDANYATLESHIVRKMQGGGHIMLSMRGLTDVPVHLDFSGIMAESLEHLTMNTYTNNQIDGDRKTGISAMFARRLLPSPHTLNGIISRYVGKRMLGMGRYHSPRASPPFLLLTRPELGLFLRLPDPATTPNTLITRRQVIPQQQATRKQGFCLGFTTPLQAEIPVDFFGMLTPSRQQSIVLSPNDIPTHIYAVGGTKSGKTTLIRCIAKHMEMANMHNTFPNAFILVDPKGSDSYDFLKQCEDTTYEANNVTFLDPIETKFSINILELPPYQKEGRQVIVSQYVGYVMQMIEYWYHGSDSFVRLKRILDTLLQYIYLDNDRPTFLDIYEIIVAMQRNGKEMLIKMFTELGKPEEVLQQAIESVATMEKRAYEPALNRLEKFATDPILRHMFCVRQSTVRFEDLIRAGAYTIIRLSPLNVPQHIITLVKQTLCIKLWFAIQERAANIRNEKDRTQVLLALDEFQDVARLPVIEAMLTQARSYGLGLLLAHQTTTQLDDSLFEVITGNAGTQFVGRVSGRDGGRFGDVWDPAYAKEIKSQLATQEYHHWTVRPIAEEGAQPLPVQFWPVYTPPNLQNDDFISKFITTQREEYSSGTVDASMLRRAAVQANRWLDNIPYEPPTREEWEILCILAEAGTSLMLKEITRRFGDGTTASDRVSKILKNMVKKKIVDTGAEGEKKKRGYHIPYETRCKYMEFDPAKIGTSADIPSTTAAACSYYLKRRFFLCVATQTVKKGKMRTDLVAYDYETSTPISIEIESFAEVKRHPEHVKLNMTKWRDMGFSRCDMWSSNPNIQRIYDEDLTADGEKDDIQIFVVSSDTASHDTTADMPETSAAKDNTNL